MADAQSTGLRLSAPRAARVEKEIFIRQLLPGVADSRLARHLATLMTEKKFPAGHVIYREGDPSRWLYLMIRGAVRLRQAGKRDLIMRGGDGFGFLDAQLELARTRTARVMEDTACYEVDVEEWFEMLEEHLDATVALVSGNGERAFMAACRRGEEAFPRVRGFSAATERKLNPFERLLALRQCPVSKRTSVQALVRLARDSESRFVKAGEVLCRQGESTTDVWLVVEGLVSIRRTDPEVQARFGPSSFVGGPGGVLAHERLFDAEAEVDTLLVAFPQERLEDLMEDHFDVAKSWMRYTADEWVRINTQVELKSVMSLGD